MQDPFNEKVDKLLSRFDQLSFSGESQDWEEVLFRKMQMTRPAQVRRKRTGYLLVLVLTILLNSFLFWKGGILSSVEEESREDVLHTVSEQLLIPSQPIN